MGAWGEGPFANDDAADLLFEVEDDGATAVGRALDAVVVVGDDVLVPAITASRGVGAAALIASVRTGTPTGDATADQVLAEHPLAVDDALAEVARRTLQRLGHHSELLELWAEQGAGDQHLAMLAAVEERLAPPRES